MTVGRLKEIIKELPSDMIVGGCGHYGELLECWDIVVQEVKEERNIVRGDKRPPKKIKILNVMIESAGDDPL